MVVVALVYLLLATGSAVTMRPGCDEGWFANPALNLLREGCMRTSVLESGNVFKAGRDFRGLDQFTYWIMPLHPIVQAGWYAVWGFGLLPMRALSITWGLVALAAWYITVTRISDDRRLPLLACGLVAIDRAFVRGAGHGRMDMMTAALGLAGFAVYLVLRKRNLTAALLAGHALVAASIMTHPNGILYGAGLVVLVVIFDRKRLRWPHLLAAGAPYAVAAAGWGLYILRAPDVFLAQFSGNAAARLWPLSSPLEALTRELTERYLVATSGLHRLKALLVVAYAVGVIGAIAIRDIRRQRGCQALLAFAGITFVYFWLFEGTKLHLYVVHISVACATLLAAVILHLWENRRLRALLSLAVAGFAAIQIGGNSYVMYCDDLHASYLPAAGYLRTHVAPDQLVMASAEMGFEQAFPPNFLDDVLIGLQSGKRPEFVVLERRYQQMLEAMRSDDAEGYRRLTQMLSTKYLPVYDHAGYVIYRRR